MAEFRNLICARMHTRLSAGDTATQAAAEALRLAVAEIEDEHKLPGSAPAWHWTGQLSCAAPVLPAVMFTHMPLRDVDRYSDTRLDATTTPPESVPISKFKIDSRNAEPCTRWVWLTFDPGTTVPDDPTEVVRTLGLAHFPAGEFLYRIPFDVRASAKFTPTALDARFYEAWAAPPAGYPQPWGLTRDIVDGELRFPELVVDVRALASQTPRATLVSPDRRNPQRIGPLTPDFMVNR
ncbi:MAG: hypothetical protein AB7Q17_08720 [Phycisphaerae bacterium]